jgi:hypothetical protein
LQQPRVLQRAHCTREAHGQTLLQPSLNAAYKQHFVLCLYSPSPTAHLCTPPMPPVTKTLMPARAASSMVPLTVVAPSKPLPSTSGISLRDTLRTAVPRLAMCSSCDLSQPATHRVKESQPRVSPKQAGLMHETSSAACNSYQHRSNRSD